MGLAATADEAAFLLQLRWREHVVDVRSRILQERRASERSRLAAAEEREAIAAAFSKSLPGASATVWGVLREAIAVMAASVALALVAPVPYATVHPLLAVGTGSKLEQLRRALLGGGVLVVAFAVLFVVLVALYVQQWPRCLCLLHSAWIGALLPVLGVGAILPTLPPSDAPTPHSDPRSLGLTSPPHLASGGLAAAPSALLLLRTCQSCKLPLDWPSLTLFAWNLALPAMIVVQWPPTQATSCTLSHLIAS